MTVCSRANFANDSCTNANVTRHTELAYDDLGRLVSSSLYAGDGITDVELVTTTTYLGDGAVASVTADETGMGGGTDTVSFTYDADGRLDLVKDGTVTLTDHVWNADDTLASRADGTAGTTAFTYDWADRLMTVDPPNATFGSGSNITRSWRLDGLLGSVTYPSGMTATTGYDSARRPVSIDLGAAGSFAAAYDRTGNVTAESRTLTGITGSAGTGAQSFTYDGLRRLASSSLAGTTTTYAYDLDGNRRSSTTGGVTTAFDYDRTGVLADRSVGGGMAYTFTYDPYGNLTGEPDAAGAVTTYGLDLADRLTSFDPPSTGATTFGYDALGRIVTRIRPDGTDTYRFTGTSEQVAGISINVGGTGTAIASLVEPAGGRPLTKQGSTTYAALPDVAGSTAAVALNSTAVAGAVRFDPWGMKLDETTTTGVGPFRYRGALELAPAGSDPLYESGARLYRPGIAAFTSLDTYAGAALEPASLNRYLYAQANPATLVDPSGHMATSNLCLYDAEDCGAVAAAGQTVRRQEGYSQRGVAKARGAEGAEAVAAGDRYISDVGTDRWADADEIAAVTESARLARCAGDTRCLAEGGWSGGAGGAEGLHGALDVGGFIPVIGIGADILNGLAYALEGDWGSAGLSFGAAVPVLGDIGKGATMLAKYGDDVVGALSHAGDDAVESAGQLAQRLGREGESAIRSGYDIGPRGYFEVAGRQRVSYGLNDIALSEVKNVRYQALTSQLRDYVAYATSQGLTVNLYVRSATTLSNPLQLWFDQGRINVIRALP